MLTLSRKWQNKLFFLVILHPLIGDTFPVDLGVVGAVNRVFIAVLLGDVVSL